MKSSALPLSDAAPGTPPGADPAAGFDLGAFLPYQLARLASGISRDFAAIYGERFGLGIPEWRVLAHLSQQDAVSVREIHRRADMDKPKVSRAAARLVAAGLVAKTAGADRRLVALSLTPAGRARMAELAPLALGLEERALAALTEAEAAAFRALVAKLLIARGARNDAGAAPAP